MSTPQQDLQIILADTPELMKRCYAIRTKVFVDEQGYDLEEEIDEKDPEADHLLLTTLSPEGERVDVGTVRLWVPGFKLGRLAVHSSMRGTGAGKYLVLALEEHIKSGKGLSGKAIKGKEEVKIVANAQKWVEVFYNKLGYATEGDDFLEEGQPHCKVVKTIKL